MVRAGAALGHRDLEDLEPRGVVRAAGLKGMERRRAERISRLLSYGLRHAPGDLGIVLDSAGWADVGQLLEALRARGEDVTAEDLQSVVRQSDKQRFALSPDQTRIRANQGHSVAVDLGLPPREPPSLLFHGTVDRFVGGIRAAGLLRGARSHVHLSVDAGTAKAVSGRRRGASVILTVRSGEMHQEGHAFYLSENGVWLVEHVPARYIDYPPGD
jgi:putative RNA 2'-phosphotransferase